MSQPSEPAAAILAAMQLKYFSTWPSMQLCEEAHRGRFIVARAPIVAGTVVFESVAYCKGVHESFKKRVCECCLRYNHSGRFERTCADCHAVWFCSAECEARANGKPTESTPPLPASELHSLDCSLLRKLSSCKLDKARIGVIRLLIRAARKMQCERIEEQKQSTDAPSSSAAASSSAPPAADAAPLLPTYRDVANLIGHAPAPVLPGRSPTLHQLDTMDMRKFLTKLVATTATSPASAASVAALPPLDVELLMDLLAKVESNAFGFFAPKKRDEAEAADQTEELAQAVEALSTNEPAAAAISAPFSSTGPASSHSTPAAPLPSAPSKYIGVLLYPIASFFNHSCESNLRCVQLHAQDVASSSSDPAASTSAVSAAPAFLGPKLVMIAKRDIAAGEELCIEYIDTERSGPERRAELQELYRFDCGCTRCVREQAAESLASSVGGKKSAASPAAVSSRPSYAAPASNRGGHTKKGAPPKRKKIIPKSMQQPVEEANANNAATADE